MKQILLLSLVLSLSIPANAGVWGKLAKEYGEPSGYAVDAAARITAKTLSRRQAELERAAYDTHVDTIRGKRQAEEDTNIGFGYLVYEEIKRLGDNANLNHLDASSVTDMIGLFWESKFNGDISNWDVSNVTKMNGMFWESKFNGDISKWDLSNVADMRVMFKDSEFNGDISKWDVSNVTNMEDIFAASKFNGDISQWDLSNVEDKRNMFGGMFNWWWWKHLFD